MLYAADYAVAKKWNQATILSCKRKVTSSENRRRKNLIEEVAQANELEMPSGKELQKLIFKRRVAASSSLSTRKRAGSASTSKWLSKKPRFSGENKDDGDEDYWPEGTVAPRSDDE